MVSIKDIIILFIQISSFILKRPYKQKVNRTTEKSPKLVGKTYQRRSYQNKKVKIHLK